jgi:hypothetical protein
MGRGADRGDWVGAAGGWFTFSLRRDASANTIRALLLMLEGTDEKRPAVNMREAVY